MVDIYGKDWPTNIVTENSGYGFDDNTSWWNRKIQILKKYHFNICFENTAYGYYCTEKIWHSIISLCLPIYQSNNSRIYETFTPDSFIDHSKFNSNEEMFDFIARMSLSEYVHRLNSCIDTFNKMRLIKKQQLSNSVNDTTQKIIYRLNILHT